MNSQQFRKFDMLRRVQRFLDDSATLAGVSATAARKELDEVVREMAENEAAEAASALRLKSHRAKRAVLRRDLWFHHMRPVAAIAAAHLREVPEFHALAMPPYKCKLPVLVQAATAMGEAAREYREVFVQNGRPADFAEALVAAAAALRASFDACGQSVSSKASARSGIRATGARAQVVLALVDAAVTSVAVDDPKLLAGWKSARRIGRGRAVPLTAGDPPVAAETTEV